MIIPVAHRVCESTGYCLRDINTPPTSRPRPARNPIVTRNTGGTRLLSNEYLTKNTTPRNSANPPTQAKPFTPTNCSQSIWGVGTRRGSKTGDGVIIGGRGGGEDITVGGSTMGLGVTGAGVTISGGFGSAESGCTGLGDSFSRFNTAISDSSASSRWD